MSTPASTSDRGSAAIEVVGTVPSLLLAGLVALQFGLLGWAAVSTQDAAEAAARAASLQQDPVTAAHGALPKGLTPVEVTGDLDDGGFSYTVIVETPSVIPFLDLGHMSRTVDMPAIT
ncbi:MAG: TadE/TadG family type IV pilus assembly protein [Propioniciclava sp.]